MPDTVFFNIAFILIIIYRCDLNRSSAKCKTPCQATYLKLCLIGRLTVCIESVFVTMFNFSKARNNTLPIYELIVYQFILFILCLIGDPKFCRMLILTEYASCIAIDGNIHLACNMTKSIPLLIILSSSIYLTLGLMIRNASIFTLHAAIYIP